MSKFLPSFPAFVGLCEKNKKQKTLKTTKKLFKVSLLLSKDSLVNFSLTKHLESLPVHSRLFNCDLR